jgi:hypothetical protein
MGHQNKRNDVLLVTKRGGRRNEKAGYVRETGKRYITSARNERGSSEVKPVSLVRRKTVVCNLNEERNREND